MKVIRATAMGMCFGVRDALSQTEMIREPVKVTILGELVHNRVVGERLERKGFGVVGEGTKGLPGREEVMITAHGISEARRRELAAAGKVIIDTTCPLVKKAHAAARRLEAGGYFVVVVGKRGHVEVEGIVGDFGPGNFAVVERAEEVRAYGQKKIGIMCQTTTASETARAVCEKVERMNELAEIKYVDTICQPTKDRQMALEHLLEQVDAVVVVGGKNSNNTRKLAERCRGAGARVWHVEEAGELRAEWFAGIGAIGVTAGTSTLEETIEDVCGFLGKCGGNFQGAIFNFQINSKC